VGKTTIEWTSTTGLDGTLHPGYTFNPWWGCQRVSPGCENCYAEAWDKRWGESHWGPGSPYKLQSEKYWAEPLKWNRKAEKLGVRLKVFCASMADVFDNGAPPEQRVRLWKLIRATPWLDWLLLTKRPDNFALYLPWVPCPTDVCKYASLSGVMCPDDSACGDAEHIFCDIQDQVGRDVDCLHPRDANRLHEDETRLDIVNTLAPWLNVWLGVTCENQKYADLRIPLLLQTPAAVRFISVEPQLEAVDLSPWLPPLGPAVPGRPGQAMLHQVICGSESGPGARPFDEAWARSLRDQCAAADVAFFLKQRLDERGRKVSLPLLDGRQHMEQPR
jgi:protein gp37